MGITCCYSCSPCQEQNEIATIIMPEVEGMQHIDDLIAYIDQLMDKIENGGQQQVVRSNSVAASVNFGANLIEKLSRPLKWHVCKKCFLCALDRQTRNLVAEVLKQAQHIPYLGMALSVIAHVLERAEQESSNKEDCLRLLKYMSDMVKHLKNLDIQLRRPKLDHILHFIVKETLMCARQMEPNRLCRFIFAPLDAADLENLQSKLVHMYPDLELQALNEVLNRLPVVPRPSQGEYPPDAVGVEQAQNEVIGLLDLNDSSCRVVVIYGVGGIGKTTLATAVFNRLDLLGHHHCRVVMDQDCTDSDLKNIQEQILQVFQKHLKLHNCTEGREELSKAFGTASKPLFLFIDNALGERDLEVLLPIQHLARLPMKSRILLTTRNLRETQIFKKKDGIQFYSHRVDSLPEREAKRVLCHYALGDKNGSFEPGVNMDGLLEVCGGIPLVLRIVGSRLRADGDTVSACNEILNYHKRWYQEGFKGGERDVAESMVDFVYRRLKEFSQEAFLDIASFFYDRERSEVGDIVGEMELRDLEGAALVTTSQERRWNRSRLVEVEVVKVHDIVRARGRKLSEGKRITDRESLSILLRDEQKLQQIKGIWLPDDEDELNDDKDKLSLEAEHLDSMSTSLRVLSLGEGMRLNGRCNSAFEHLRFLRSCYEDMLPINISKSRHLVYFSGVCISEGKFTINLPDSLRLLDLSAPRYYPVSLDICGHLTSLNQLRLSDITFQNFGSSIGLGNFSCLKRLQLTDTKLERLPESFGSLSSLQELHMDGCSMVERLPESFGSLSSLQQLEMDGWSKLERLPESFGSLSSLQELYMNDCSMVESLPESFGSLSSLQKLFMNGYSKLERLPESFGSLSSLQELYMDDCSMVESLPESFGSLSSLQQLRMADWSKLERLPESFGSLSSLQGLYMDGCSMVERLPESFGSLSSLQQLDMHGCSMVERLPESFGSLSSLQGLYMRGCSMVESLPESFGSLSSLQRLYMGGCSMVERLPESFMSLSSLQELYMNGCSMVERLPESFGSLSSLQRLRMDGCSKLERLPQRFGQLKSLKFLKISNCKGLKSLSDDILCLTSLAMMRAYGCAELEAKAMDSLVEIKSLLFLEMGESPMLIKRWEEIRQHRPLIGAALRFEIGKYPYEEIMCAMFFNGGSRLVHVDGEGQLAEEASWFPEVGGKVALLLTACAPSDGLREKLSEVGSEGYEIVYVDVDVDVEGEERKKRIRERLMQLPHGCRAWTSPSPKTTLLFAYSLWRFTAHNQNFIFLKGVDTCIVGTSVEADEEGRRKLSLYPRQMIYESDGCDSPRLDFAALFSPLGEAWRFCVK